MRCTFIALRAFSSLVRSYKLPLEDLRAIENAIMAGPAAWPVVIGTGGIRKMRFASGKSGAGKSGGFRVCYLVIEEQRHVYLFTLYAKNDAQNLTSEQKDQMAALVREIKNYYRHGATK